MYLIIHRERFLLGHLVVSKLLYRGTQFILYLNTDYIHKIDEIRTGFNSRTFDRLRRHKYIDENEVSESF